MSLLHLSAAHSNDYCCVVGGSNSAYIKCYINSDERGTKRAARKTRVKIKWQIGWLVCPRICYVWIRDTLCITFWYISGKSQYLETFWSLMYWILQHLLYLPDKILLSYIISVNIQEKVLHNTYNIVNTIKIG